MKNNKPVVRDQRPGGDLGGRKILLGVTGGIASYKAVELARLLIKAGARVQVVMTEAATKFVSPLTFESITARDVFIEMFPDHGKISPWHTEMATWPDIAVIAPASANHMAKLAVGIADDLLTTLMLTVERQRVLCPAMNPRMWANPATQENLATLKRRGYRVIMPDEGQMARPGEEDGVGRLAEPDAIFREVRHILSAPQDLRGVRVLVTAGRTEESWDPVRVLTNRASGRMGFALAEEARERGAEVMLIHGPTDVVAPTGVRIRRVTTAADMAAAVRQEFHHCNILLMSAAVADYTFADTVDHKIKKGAAPSDMKLVATEDILKGISANKGNRIIVGFALETENVLENALRKLREKHLDIVVANNPLEHGSGFSTDTNQVMIIHRSGRVDDLPLQSKREVAREILNAVINNYRNPEPEPEPDVEVNDDARMNDDFDVDVDEELEANSVTSVAATPPPMNGRRDRDRDPRGKRRRGKKRHGDQPLMPAQNSQASSTPPPRPSQQPLFSPPVSRSEPQSITTPPIVQHAQTNGKHDAVGTEMTQVPGEKKKGRSRRGGRRQKERMARAAMRQGVDAAPAAMPVASTPPQAKPQPIQTPIQIPAAVTSEVKKPRGKVPAAKPKPVKKAAVEKPKVKKPVAKTAKPKPAKKKVAVES